MKHEYLDGLLIEFIDQEFIGLQHHYVNVDKMIE